MKLSSIVCLDLCRKLIYLACIVSSTRLLAQSFPPLGETNSPTRDLNLCAQHVFLGEYQPHQEFDQFMKDRLELDWGVSANEFEYKPLADASYRIVVDAAPECNPWMDQLAVPKSKFRENVYAQVKEAAMFLSEYHQRMFGRNAGFYKLRSIRICTAPQSFLGNSLVYDRFKSQLTVHMGPKATTNQVSLGYASRYLRLRTRANLLQAWQAGDMFDLAVPVVDAVHKMKHPLRAYWNFINPISDLRVGLRETIYQGIMHLRLHLDEILSAEQDGDYSNVISELVGMLSQTDANLSHKIAELTGNQAEGFVNALREKINSRDLAENITIGVLSAALRHSGSVNTKITRRQFGIVNVENAHLIDVILTGGEINAEINSYASAIPVSDQVQIDVTQVGLVNVSTTDQVNVDVAVSSLSNHSTLLAVVIKGIIVNMRVQPLTGEM